MLAKFNLRVLSHIVFAYMILAFGWWTVHLWRQNETMFQLDTKLLEVRFSAQKQGINLTELARTAEFQALANRYHRRHRMIFWEGLIISFCLLAGLWLVNRSAAREVAATRQQRNFLLSITHELKSPLAGIRLVVETLHKRGLTRPQLEKLCAGGLRETDRLQNLVNDILLAARLEENWKPLPEPLDLGAMVRDVTAGLALRFPGANFRLQVPENLPPVQADKAGLTAVLQNLLENALKYAPEGEVVDFSAEKSPGGKIRLQVADLGPGIPNGEKERVFEKFYRIGNEETRHSKGTGLGLYIVRQVVRAHGGSIRILDNKPRGAVFAIEI